MNFNELKSKFTFLDDLKINQLEKYKILLQKWNKVMDLTAVDDDEGVVEKHFYDSLLSSNYVSYNNESIIDVGTGAGFPGLVLKIAFPELKVTLLEPTTKRCNFLNAVIEELHLENIKVVNKRAEEYIHEENIRENFDMVTARAVSNLQMLLELTIPFLKVDGSFIALKGKKVDEEIECSSNALKVLSCSVVSNNKVRLPSEQENRAILIIKKNKKTDAKYPRIYGTIKKKPL